MSNCPRCQIVLLAWSVSNCPKCQIVLGVKLSHNPNYDLWGAFLPFRNTNPTEAFWRLPECWPVMRFKRQPSSCSSHPSFPPPRGQAVAYELVRDAEMPRRLIFPVRLSSWNLFCDFPQTIFNYAKLCYHLITGNEKMKLQEQKYQTMCNIQETMNIWEIALHSNNTKAWIT